MALKGMLRDDAYFSPENIFCPERGVDAHVRSGFKIAIVKILLFQQIFKSYQTLLFCFVIYAIIDALREDIAKKATTHIERVNMTIAECRRDYIQNECDPSIRVTILEDFCRSREECMAKDPSSHVLKSTIVAELLGDVINTFTKQLDWKALAFVVVSILM